MSRNWCLHRFVQALIHIINFGRMNWGTFDKDDFGNKSLQTWDYLQITSSSISQATKYSWLFGWQWILISRIGFYNIHALT